MRNYLCKHRCDLIEFLLMHSYNELKTSQSMSCGLSKNKVKVVDVEDNEVQRRILHTSNVMC